MKGSEARKRRRENKARKMLFFRLLAFFADAAIAEGLFLATK
jgi:hypothetical protein